MISEKNFSFEDLKEKGVIDSDSKVFSLKNQIYVKYFNENNIDFLLEGVRNLATTKDENGTFILRKLVIKGMDRLLVANRPGCKTIKIDDTDDNIYGVVIASVRN